MKSFVRKVRSKSPFRRRKRADSLIRDIKKKEQEFLKSESEIEIILDTPETESGLANRNSRGNQRQPQTNNTCTRNKYSPALSSGRNAQKNVLHVPDLVASSSVSTEEPTTPQEASRRFMEKQQQNASRNRRKSFRDRFMPSFKTSQQHNQNKSSNKEPPQNQASKNTNRREQQQASRQFEQPSVVPARGRSRDKATPGTNSMVSRVGRTRALSPFRRSSPNNNDMANPLLDQEKSNPSRPQHDLESDPIVRPVHINVRAQSKVSELSSPAAILRQESLGAQSIVGVRMALQKIERELAHAENAGKRVPRDKIMKALNFMAMSVHEHDQIEELEKELDEWIDQSVMTGHQGDDESESSEDDDDDDASSSTFDMDVFDDVKSTAKKDQLKSPVEDLFDRLGKFFGITDDNKQAVQEALGDLLWSEQYSRANGKGPPPSLLDDPSRDVRGSFETEDSFDFDPITCGPQDSQLDSQLDPITQQTARSWWRRSAIVDVGNDISNSCQPPTNTRRAPSPESRLAMPSPTGFVNSRQRPRTTKLSSNTSRSSRNQRKMPPKPATSIKLLPSQFAMEESLLSGWSSIDDTEFWQRSERFSKPNQMTRGRRYSDHARSKVPSSAAQISRGQIESNWFDENNFAPFPKEDDEFEDSWAADCLHIPESRSHNRMKQSSRGAR